MRTRRFLPTLLGAALLLSLTGCPFFVGTPLFNWAVKALQGRLTDTTADEWLAVAGVINEVAPQVQLSLSEAQAQAIVDFLQANDLNRVREVVDLVRRARQDPSVIDELEIPDSVIEVFGNDQVDLDELASDVAAEGPLAS